MVTNLNLAFGSGQPTAWAMATWHWFTPLTSA